MKNMCEEKFDIIIIAGQSNAEGFGVGPVECEYVPSDRILWLKDDADAHFEQVNGKEDPLIIVNGIITYHNTKFAMLML